MRQGCQKLVFDQTHALDLVARLPFRFEQSRALFCRGFGGLVELGIVDGVGCLRGDAHHQALRALLEHVALGMAEEQPADHLARTRGDGYGQVAAHGQVTRRHAVVRAHLAVTGIFGDVADAQHDVASESVRENRRRARMAEILECLARRAGERVKLEHVAAVAAHRVEESAELRARELGRGVGHRLHESLELQFGSEGRPRLVQDLQDALLLLELLRDLQ